MRQQKLKAMKTMAVLRFFWFLLAVSCYEIFEDEPLEDSLTRVVQRMEEGPYGEKPIPYKVPLISKTPTETLYMIKRDYHLYDPRVKQRVEPKRWWTSILDYITKKWHAFLSTEYIDYYDTSKQVQAEASEELIRKLAEKLWLIGPLPADQNKIRSSKVYADQSATPAIYLALEALQKDDLPLRERLWALGALASLEKYSPRTIEDGGIRTVIFRGPLSRGELELSLIGNRNLGPSVRALWSPHGGSLSDTVLQEALSRVELIGTMKAEIETDRTPKPSKGFISIHDWVLALGSSTSDQNVKSILIQCQENIQKEDISIHEKKLITNVIEHFVQYNLYAREQVVKLLKTDDTFQLNFHGVSAQKIIPDIFSKPVTVSKLEPIFEPFKDLQSLIVPEMKVAMETFEKLEDPQAEGPLYQLMSAASSARKDIQQTLLIRLENSKTFRLQVIKIWKELYPDLHLNLGQVPPLSFEYTLFERQPKLLSAARREILTQTLQFTHNSLLQPIKLKMKNLPLNPEYGQKQSEELWQEIVTGLKNENKNLEESRARSQIFEALAQFLSYQPAYKANVMEGIKNDKTLREKLYALSQEISHASSAAPRTTSDVAEYYAKWLSSVIVPEPKDLVYNF